MAEKIMVSENKSPSVPPSLVTVTNTLKSLERKGAASAKLRSYSVKATVVSACEIKAPPVGVAWSERNCR